MPTLGITAGGPLAALSGVSLMARVRGSAGRLITRASLSSITYQVTNLTDAEVTGTGTLTISAVVFDDLQTADTDPRWEQDGPGRPGPDKMWGFNFSATLAATLFEATDVDADAIKARPKLYQIDVIFTPTSGQPFRCVFHHTPLKVYG